MTTMAQKIVLEITDEDIAEVFDLFRSLVHAVRKLEAMVDVLEEGVNNPNGM